MKLLHPVNIKHYNNADIGSKVADIVTGFMGSWRFIIIQTCIVTSWVIINSIHGWEHWDEYPFILLNLAFSLQAAYASPLILLAGNRQSSKDRETLEYTMKLTDEEEKQNLEILEEIKNNTELTNKILSHLQGGK